ncbi:P-loop ATPase [Acinetobacter bohemicus]|uniref:KAP family P-loop domain-containing protein n=1 Tax=Acinetobacter bohemicus TaxID=1435036 RepID=A0A1I6Q7T2_9GAMM|nr:P-loop NTPase fold protein [Acinetobacter bohemicus]KAB0654152.1 P-loop ATPase [Acinetobacter bohemicus]SFS48533.1 KAP family P-loop domain-containing protein [Acinetobacter bohemicus]
MTEQNQLNWQRDNFENIEEAWQGDLWDHRRLGEQLTNYVDRLQCGAVLALDARWGEGKTWFVRHWQRHLENEDHNVVYLDTFANDYLDDPFLVVTSEITNILSKDKKTKGKVKKLIDLSASVGSALLPSLPKVALTLGLHLIGAGFFNCVLQQGYENAKDEIDKLSDEASDRIKESIQEKIACHEAEKKTLSEFKKHLAETVVRLDKPLVFIIDELDHCRPDFAIRLIERIKHFFDIPKIVFILVMNKPQLIQSVHSLYGYSVETNGDYFEKFIDFTIKFPQLGKTNNYEMLLKEELYRIGEIKDKEGLNELYFWILALQLYKNYNSREFVRKINQYALLKTNNFNKDMILIAIIFDSDFKGTVQYFRGILRGLLEYMTGKPVSRDYDNYIARNLMVTLNQKYELTSFGLLELADQLENIMKIYTTSGQVNEKERTLLSLYSDYSVTKLSKSDEFVDSWKNYIESGFISETQVES